MWAAGWYLYSLYQLHGIRETEWNIRFDPYLGDAKEPVSFDLMNAGKELSVRISGDGSRIGRLSIDGNPSASAVLPSAAVSGPGVVDIRMGALDAPMLMALGAVLNDARYDARSKRLRIGYTSFVGHAVDLEFHATAIPKQVRVNGRVVRGWTAHRVDDRVVIRLTATQAGAEDQVELRF
jgi:hypothetical protein